MATTKSKKKTSKKRATRRATKRVTAKRPTPPTKSEALKARGKPPEKTNVGRLKQGKTKGEQIIIPEPVERIMEVVLIGDEPLVVHAWDKKAIRILYTIHSAKEEMTKKQKDALREPKDPFKDFLGSLYHDRDGYLCFRSIAFKKAMIEACRNVPNVTMTRLHTSPHVVGEFCPVLGWPNNRLDMVKVGPKTDRQPDIRFRGEYTDWAVKLRLSYIESIIKPEHILNLLVWAGKTIGVGEWRLEKNGPFGRFHVASDLEAQAVCKKLDQHRIDELNPENTNTIECLQKIGVLYEAA